MENSSNHKNNSTKDNSNIITNTDITNPNNINKNKNDQAKSFNLTKIVLGVFVVGFLSIPLMSPVLFFLVESPLRTIFFIELVLIGTVILCIALILTTLSTKTKYYKVFRTPLSLAKYCYEGTPAHVEGIIESDEFLESPHRKEKCVFYHYIEEELRKKKDSSYWVVVKNEMKFIPFKIRDESGSIWVDLRNIDMIGNYIKISRKLKESHQNFVDYGNSEILGLETKLQNFIYNQKGFLGLTFGSQRRAKEILLIPNQKVLVYGWVFKENGKKVIAENKEVPLIVSSYNRKEFEKRKGGKFNIWKLALIVGFCCNILLLLLPLISIWIKLIIALLYFICSIYSSYNHIYRLEERCENARNQIYLELKKRSDLIPNLIILVNAYSQHEKNLIKILTEIRSDFSENISKKDFEEYLESEKKLSKFFSISEKYPKLKASESFKNFEEQLTMIENHIAHYRGFYNNQVLQYNTFISLFPFNLLAKITKNKEKEFFNSHQ